MGRYVIRRLIQAALMIFIVASLVAVFIQFIPGDPAYVILGEERATEDRVEAIRERPRPQPANLRAVRRLARWNRARRPRKFADFRSADSDRSATAHPTDLRAWRRGGIHFGHRRYTARG